MTIVGIEDKGRCSARFQWFCFNTLSTDEMQRSPTCNQSIYGWLCPQPSLTVGSAPVHYSFSVFLSFAVLQPKRSLCRERGARRELVVAAASSRGVGLLHFAQKHLQLQPARSGSRTERRRISNFSVPSQLQHRRTYLRHGRLERPKWTSKL